MLSVVAGLMFNPVTSCGTWATSNADEHGDRRQDLEADDGFQADPPDFRASDSLAMPTTTVTKLIGAMIIGARLMRRRRTACLCMASSEPVLHRRWRSKICIDKALDAWATLPAIARFAAFAYVRRVFTIPTRAVSKVQQHG